MLKLSRRRLIQNSLGIGALGSLALLKPSDIGSNHSDYFGSLSLALKKAEFSKPTLIIDKQRLNHNLKVLIGHINQAYLYRIVVKSLPSIPLLKYISLATQSERFMVFDEAFLVMMTQHFEQGDFLLGKPLPAFGAKKALDQMDRATGSNIRWLVDNLDRINNYKELAIQRQQTLRINLELDIGLHRGGFASEEDLTAALTLIKQEPLLEFDGFMGYEPHVVKIPGNPNSHLNKALEHYRQNISLAKKILGASFPQSPIFNTAGSPSYQLHCQVKGQEKVCNELSAGSCLVKPCDFDLPTLTDHQAASFIATPILKALNHTQIPGVPKLGDIMAWWNPNLKRSLFTYGGNWKAKPVSPAGLSYNPLYGRSSNQEMLNASLSNTLTMNDWIFLRPTQSEAVFLQFGDIAIYDDHKFVDSWPVFIS